MTHRNQLYLKNTYKGVSLFTKAFIPRGGFIAFYTGNGLKTIL